MSIKDVVCIEAQDFLRWDRFKLEYVESFKVINKKFHTEWAIRQGPLKIKDVLEFFCDPTNLKIHQCHS